MRRTWSRPTISGLVTWGTGGGGWACGCGAITCPIVKEMEEHTPRRLFAHSPPARGEYIIASLPAPFDITNSSCHSQAQNNPVSPLSIPLSPTHSTTSLSTLPPPVRHSQCSAFSPSRSPSWLRSRPPLVLLRLSTPLALRSVAMASSMPSTSPTGSSYILHTPQPFCSCTDCLLL